MSGIFQRWKSFFRPGDLIPAWWLTTIARWTGGMYSPDGSVEVIHNPIGIALQVRRDTYASATPFDPEEPPTDPQTLYRVNALYNWRYYNRKFQGKWVTFSAYDPHYAATWVDLSATIGTCATP